MQVGKSSSVREIQLYFSHYNQQTDKNTKKIGSGGRHYARGEVGNNTSVTAERIVNPGILVFIFMYTASLGWTRMTSSFRGISLKIPLVTSLY
jgi:hypothetical protein